jgi:hypothetical protein
MEDLSRYAAPEGTIPFEGHEKLRLNDLQVCQLIGPYILAAINSLELISSVRKPTAPGLVPFWDPQNT